MEESWKTETKIARGISNVSFKCHFLDQQTCETKVILRSTQHSKYLQKILKMHIFCWF